MSDIAKKTLPPGSRPGKAAAPTDKTTEKADSTAPRSVSKAAPSESHAQTEDAQSDDLSPGHYTHTKDGGETENPLEDIPEEKASTQRDGDEGIQMKDNTTSQSKSNAGADESASQAETADDRTEDASNAPASSKTSMLTEQAKRAFDQASENQPTDEAREEFSGVGGGAAGPEQKGRGGRG